MSGRAVTRRWWPITTWSGADPCTTSVACSRCSASREPRPGCRGRPSSGGGTAIARRTTPSTPSASRPTTTSARSQLLQRSAHRPQPHQGPRLPRERRSHAAPARRRGQPRQPTSGASSVARPSSTTSSRWRRCRRRPRSPRTCRRDLKRRGFSFVGPVIVYAYMQSIGLVNDHLVELLLPPRGLTRRPTFEVPAPLGWRPAVLPATATSERGPRRGSDGQEVQGQRQGQGRQEGPQEGAAPRGDRARRRRRTGAARYARANHQRAGGRWRTPDRGHHGTGRAAGQPVGRAAAPPRQGGRRRWA